VADNGDATAGFKQAAYVVSGTYLGPYESHGTMAPNCAVADVKSYAALVMCSDQAIYQTRSAVRRSLVCLLTKCVSSFTPARTATAAVATWTLRWRQ
jgi:hypothetical protein